MQELASVASTWASRFTGHAQRSPSSGPNTRSEDRATRYYAKMQMLDQCTSQEIKMAAEKMCEEFVQDVKNLSPLPSHFDYSYALVSYVWLLLIMTSKTLGHRLVRMPLVHTVLEAMLSRWVAVVLLYIQLPAYTLLINQKISEKQMNRNMRRISIIVLAFFYGFLGEFIWLHWVDISTSAPHYYYPAIVGAMLQIAGPHLGHNRFLLLSACVSAAVSVSIGIAAYNEVLTIYYIGTTILSASSSLLNLQLLIGDLRKHGSDERSMICGHYRAVIVSTYSHAFLTLLCARYDRNALNEAKIAQMGIR